MIKSRFAMERIKGRLIKEWKQSQLEKTRVVFCSVKSRKTIVLKEY